MQTADFEQELAGALRLLQWSQTEGGNADLLVLDALAKARRLALRVGEDSNLVLDPQLDSYYLQNVIVSQLPVVLGHLGEAQTLFRGAAAAAPATERRVRFLVLDGLLRSTAEGVRDNLAGAYRGNADGSLRPAVASEFAAMIRSANAYLGALNATIVAGERTEIDAAALDRFHATAVANTIRAWGVAGNELDRLLQLRIDGLLRGLYGSLALTGALGIFSILFAVMTHRHIVRPLERLELLTSTVRETKDYTFRSFYNSRDEIGRLAGAFNDMLAELARARERELAEQARKVATQAELARVARLTAMGEMTASIAHEINQPLAAIVANANAGLRWLANATPDLDETQAALKRIVNEGHRASEVIGSIRTLFKKDDQARAPLDVNELIREILALMHGQLEKSSGLAQNRAGRAAPARRRQSSPVAASHLEPGDERRRSHGRGGRPPARAAHLLRDPQPARRAGDGGGFRNGHRSGQYQPDLRRLLHHEVDRHGDGTVDLPFDHRSAWRQPDGCPGASARIGFSGLPAGGGGRGASRLIPGHFPAKVLIIRSGK